MRRLYGTWSIISLNESFWLTAKKNHGSSRSIKRPSYPSNWLDSFLSFHELPVVTIENQSWISPSTRRKNMRCFFVMFSGMQNELMHVLFHKILWFMQMGITLFSWNNCSITYYNFYLGGANRRSRRVSITEMYPNESNGQSAKNFVPKTMRGK